MDINTIITMYLKAKEQESIAKKQAETAKKIILDYAKNNDHFVTDVYTVIVKTSDSIRLDTKTLYNDFPDIKETYGKVTTSQTITAVENTTATEKTA